MSGQAIDATRRGGIARYANHSCDPTAQAQLWQVGGCVNARDTFQSYHSRALSAMALMHTK
eukprot:8977-Eustigmatos_ZCMA.PRE.1